MRGQIGSMGALGGPIISISGYYFSTWRTAAP